MRIGLMRTAWLLGAIGLLSASATAGSGDGDTPALANTVRLEIQISGLGANGGKVTIKPAHPGCKFKPVTIPIAKGASTDVLKLDPIAVSASTTSADRDCSFEITLTEPGREPKTFRRGLRLNPPIAGATIAPSRTLKCYLPATAVAIKEDGKSTPPRR
jgi:hypothetical protein